MDDADWMIEDPNDVQPEPASEAEAAPADGAAAGEATAEAAGEEVQGTEPKKQLWKHWVRPKFLQYNYLYDYRKNYYDDVIHYLDRRNRGLPTEPPRAQEWAERALRTYVSNNCSDPMSWARREDKALLRHISVGQRFHRYHIKSIISRKYSDLGFSCVTIAV